MIRNRKELIVVGDRVVVKVEEGEERTTVGLYLPPTAGNADQGLSAAIDFNWRATGS